MDNAWQARIETGADWAGRGSGDWGQLRLVGAGRGAGTCAIPKRLGTPECLVTLVHLIYGYIVLFYGQTCTLWTKYTLWTKSVVYGQKVYFYGQTRHLWTKVLLLRFYGKFR
jgi:hypothetical protein